MIMIVKLVEFFLIEMFQKNLTKLVKQRMEATLW